MEEKFYYEPQTDWGVGEYYYLHRRLHRLLFYYKKYESEIRSMDLSKMSPETKVLMYCIIKYYHNDFLMETYENLHDLVNTKPLERTLVIDENVLNEDDIYKAMNVRC